ncbi:hypothetical protein [Arthrobacter sp. zg-Y1143]|uniref:hypothetical protein n=1 Tax=Arthrobacter sp. zg-Y1143 TaxID=3049065 RepID=UPI0024C4290B|nr:hypothetical protein [Arthrobacter sp. zg-Y1143]MDK1328713.1 hypothetical protein [Arthrobacter sp. zg-Y1143]
MKPQSTAARPSRHTISRFIRVVLIGGVILLAGGVIAAAGARMDPAPLAALTGGAVCVAGISGIVFQGMGRWDRDPGYLLTRKTLATTFILSASGMALLFWSSIL